MEKITVFAICDFVFCLTAVNGDFFVNFIVVCVDVNIAQQRNGVAVCRSGDCLGEGCILCCTDFGLVTVCHRDKCHTAGKHEECQNS